MRSADIEKAIWLHWARKQNRVICHNVSWGMFNHECDILVLEQDNTFTEIEIKVSKSDVKKDLQKPHKHESKKISRLYFAIPEDLYRPDVIELIPDRAGILVVTTKLQVQNKRKPAKPKTPYTAKENEIRQLAYLLQFRFWKERIKANNLNQKLIDNNQVKLNL
jgi:hypothetical protein